MKKKLPLFRNCHCSYRMAARDPKHSRVLDLHTLLGINGDIHTLNYLRNKQHSCLASLYLKCLDLEVQLFLVPWMTLGADVTNCKPSFVSANILSIRAYK